MKITFIQKIIDRFRNKVLYLKSFYDKYETYKAKKDFKTLILGSSHIFDYQTNEDELNMAFASQDLYSSYMLYKNLNHKNLKNILISFSVFTPGHCVIKTADYQMSILYKLLYDIDYEYEDVAKKKNLYKEEKYIKKQINKYANNKNLYNRNKIARLNNDENYIKNRALKHLKNNLREPDEMRWCEKLLEEANANNQTVLFYLPPARSIYKNVLPKSEELFNKLYDLSSKFDNAKILNFYDENICDDNFIDGDHLNINYWNNHSNDLRIKL